MRQHPGYIPRDSVISGEEWYQFYRGCYPPRQLTILEIEGNEDPFLDGVITEAEVIESLKKLKLGKTPGEDGISNEFLRALPGNWVLYVTSLFNKILKGESVPLAWASVLMTMIHKKGDKTNPANYRGIALVNCIAKWFTMILRERLRKWATAHNKIPECQAGFVEGKGCLDNIYVLSSAIQFQLRLGHRKIYALFVDFKRAFDSINHDKLWMKLLGMGISAKIIRTLKNLYDQANLQVRTGDGLSEATDITEGVLQVEILSPLLFILFIADIEVFFRDRGAIGVNLDGLNDLLLMLYADDLAILAYSPIDLKKSFEFCTSTVNRMG